MLFQRHMSTKLSKIAVSCKPRVASLEYTLRQRVVKNYANGDKVAVYVSGRCT